MSDFPRSADRRDDWKEMMADISTRRRPWQKKTTGTIDYQYDGQYLHQGAHMTKGNYRYNWLSVWWPISPPGGAHDKRKLPVQLIISMMANISTRPRTWQKKTTGTIDYQYDGQYLHQAAHMTKENYRYNWLSVWWPISPPGGAHDKRKLPEQLIISMMISPPGGAHWKRKLPVQLIISMMANISTRGRPWQKKTTGTIDYQYDGQYLHQGAPMTKENYRYNWLSVGGYLHQAAHMRKENYRNNWLSVGGYLHQAAHMRKENYRYNWLSVWWPISPPGGAHEKRKLPVQLIISRRISPPGGAHEKRKLPEQLIISRRISPPGGAHEKRKLPVQLIISMMANISTRGRPWQKKTTGTIDYQYDGQYLHQGAPMTKENYRYNWLSVWWPISPPGGAHDKRKLPVQLIISMMANISTRWRPWQKKTTGTIDYQYDGRYLHQAAPMTKENYRYNWLSVWWPISPPGGAHDKRKLPVQLIISMMANISTRGRPWQKKTTGTIDYQYDGQYLHQGAHMTKENYRYNWLSVWWPISPPGGAHDKRKLPVQLIISMMANISTRGRPWQKKTTGTIDYQYDGQYLHQGAHMTKENYRYNWLSVWWPISPPGGAHDKRKLPVQLIISMMADISTRPRTWQKKTTGTIDYQYDGQYLHQGAHMTKENYRYNWLSVWWPISPPGGAHDKRKLPVQLIISMMANISTRGRPWQKKTTGTIDYQYDGQYLHQGAHMTKENYRYNWLSVWWPISPPGGAHDKRKLPEQLIISMMANISTRPRTWQKKTTGTIDYQYDGQYLHQAAPMTKENYRYNWLSVWWPISPPGGAHDKRKLPVQLIISMMANISTRGRTWQKKTTGTIDYQYDGQYLHQGAPMTKENYRYNWLSVWWPISPPGGAHDKRKLPVQLIISMMANISTRGRTWQKKTTGTIDYQYDGQYLHQGAHMTKENYRYNWLSVWWPISPPGRAHDKRKLQFSARLA